MPENNVRILRYFFLSIILNSMLNLNLKQCWELCFPKCDTYFSVEKIRHFWSLLCSNWNKTIICYYYNISIDPNSDEKKNKFSLDGVCCEYMSSKSKTDNMSEQIHFQHFIRIEKKMFFEFLFSLKTPFNQNCQKIIISF